MEYKDLDLDVKDASQLRIRAGRHLQQWVLVNAQGRIIRIEETMKDQFPVWLSEIDAKDSLEVAIMLPALGQTWIPEVLYDPNVQEVYSRYVDGLSFIEADRIDVSAIQAKSIYRSDRYLTKALLKHFPQSTLHVPLNNMVQGYASYFKTHSASGFVIDLFDGEAMFLYFKNGDFQFHQQVEFDEIGDLAYALLLVQNELQVELSSMECFVSGAVSQHDHTYQLLNSLFYEIKDAPVDAIANVNVFDTFEQLTNYFSLLVPVLYAHHRG